MLDKETYEEMKSRYSHLGSWTIWEDVGLTPKSNTDNMDWINNPNLLDFLNSHYVFVGLNWSRGDISFGGKIPWANFHSGSTHQNDYKLRYALKDTRFWGSYITDIIKLHSEPDSGRVKDYIRYHPKLVEENIKSFVEEISFLDNDVVLIALGNDVYRLLKTWLGGKYKIVKIVHYSNYIGHEEYRTLLLETLNEV